MKKTEVTVGEIIAGKFRVDRILGQGGMGVVVLATHLVLEEQFALKLLRPELAADPDTVERFSREAKACVRIKSEHVARVHDVGMREDGTPFMVMEYLEGIDLGTALQEQGALPIEEAVEYVIQACEALAQAHAIGIVHRDIKPENLFMVTHTEGWRSIKLLDFGISKAIPAPRSRDFASSIGSGPESSEVASPPAADSARETRVMGTPHYMSPEQMQQLDIDGRADVWSLGVVLYELCTANYAWGGNTVQEVTQAILKGKAPWLETVRPDAPAGLSEAVERCLQKDPAERYPNVAELAIALLPFAPKRA
ncbi:MAG TPA: serine/threonine-protein kinase, partial [Polyangiaceae bacterium]|nr:serine/threonine-protein kinase [Polyangiaceae bacterium]